MKRKKLLIVLTLTLFLYGCVSGDYDKALTLMESGDFAGAKAIFTLNPDYKDTPELIAFCQMELDYAEAERLLDEGEYERALELYEDLGSFRSSRDRSLLCMKYLDYSEAAALAEAGQWADALQGFAALGDFLDSKDGMIRCQCEIMLAEVEGIMRSVSDGERPDDANEAYSQAIELLADMPDAAATRERAVRLYTECVFNQTVINVRERAGKTGDNGDFSAFAERFASCGEFGQAQQMAAVLNALSKRDPLAFSESMIEYEEEISAVVDPRDLYDRFFEWDVTLDESLMLLDLYYRYNASGEYKLLEEIEPEFRWSVDTGDWIFDRVSHAESAKLIIIVRLNKPDGERYVIPLSVMSALPENIRLSSLDEAGYILYINYDYAIDGTYDIGTKGIREYVDITLQRSSDRETIRSWERINGQNSPESFEYSGEPPKYVSGGAPDHEKTLECFLDAVDYLDGTRS